MSRSTFTSSEYMEGRSQYQEKNSSHIKAHRVPRATGAVHTLGVGAMLVRSVLSLQMAKVPCTTVSAAHGSAA